MAIVKTDEVEITRRKCCICKQPFATYADAGFSVEECTCGACKKLDLKEREDIVEKAAITRKLIEEGKLVEDESPGVEVNTSEKEPKSKQGQSSPGRHLPVGYRVVNCAGQNIARGGRKKMRYGYQR